MEEARADDDRVLLTSCSQADVPWRRANISVAWKIVDHCGNEGM